MYIVLFDLGMFTKPMVILHEDGNKPVPEPGCLFLCTGDLQPTMFEDEAKADTMIRHTLVWRPGERERYSIVDKDFWDTYGTRITRKKEVRKKKADAKKDE